MHVENLSF